MLLRDWADRTLGWSRCPPPVCVEAEVWRTVARSRVVTWHVARVTCRSDLMQSYSTCPGSCSLHVSASVSLLAVAVVLLEHVSVAVL